MNLERTKPETLAAAALDLTPSHFTAAHEYAERLNAALARLGLTDRLTLPPAPNTAIDELPAVVDVPLRKTLSVLMGKAQQGDASALATLEMTAQVMESIFAGLHARDFAGDRPLALPSAESLATLAQGVDALLPRKISTGWSVASLIADPTCDGIDDGVSLVRLLCSDAADSVTELKDDNEGWICDKLLRVLYNACHAKKVVLNAKSLTFNNDKGWTEGCTNIEQLEMPELETINFPKSVGYEQSVFSGMSIERLYFPKLKSYTSGGYGVVVANSPVKYIDIPQFTTLQCVHANRVVRNCAELLELNIPNYAGPSNSWDYRTIDNCPKIRKVVIGECYLGLVISGEHPDLIEVQIAEGYNIALPMGTWNPTSVLSDSERLPEFLANFKTYIAERLSEQGSGLTLTLSQAVRDAIEGDPTIAQIITSKGWTISPAPSV